MNASTPEHAVIAPTPVDSRRITRHALRAAGAVMALTLGLMLLLAHRALDALQAQDRRTEMAAIDRALSVSMERAARFALGQAEALARQPALAPLLRRGDRAALQAQTQATYDYLSTQAGVSVLGFHTADLRYLLRMHRQDAPVDDIAAARPMVLAARRSGQPQSGVEVGVSGIVGVRGVAVLREAGQVVGTAEVGVDLLPLLEDIRTTTNAEVAVVVSRALSGLDPAPGGLQVTVGDLTLAAATDTALFGRLLREERLPPGLGHEQTELQLDGRRHALAVQPLVDYSGRQIGSVLALRDRAAHDTLRQRSRVELALAALCGGLLAWAALRALCGLALRPPRAGDEAGAQA
ncbi:cache domain-containing protein [Ideonella livida]|uniref:Chemotaxis protein n=1 Tax=Ideonella livida TaxID=2707176 RepID=A0A7C9TP90_9BURK|nr:cache domain-containing protein [Ideonella livida]NDY93486.1 chemotaxis protein [Ideonella livida]